MACMHTHIQQQVKIFNELIPCTRNPDGSPVYALPLPSEVIRCART